MVGRVVASGLYLLGIPFLFRPFWPDTHEYETLNWSLFVGASAIAGLAVGKWALALPWVLVIAAVVGVGIYIAVLNASDKGSMYQESPLSGVILVVAYAPVAAVANAAMVAGIWLRTLRFASRFARPS